MRVVAAFVVAVGVCAALLGVAVARSPDPSGFATLLARRERAEHAPPVVLADVSPALREAVVATEDERFWSHHGVDVLGLVRAAAYDVTHLSAAQGGSTITEQLCKQLYLGGDDHSLWRKLEDAVTAFRLESRVSKDRILSAYLSSVYLGDGSYGVARASERYFGVAPSRLTLAQATMLAGLVQAPSAYDPYRHPEAARRRQEAVLLSMMRARDLPAPRADAVLAAPIRLADGRTVPGIADAQLAVGASFSSAELAGGLALIAVSLAVALTRRRRRVSRRTDVGAPVAWRAATVGALALGLVIAVRSFRVG